MIQESTSGERPVLSASRRDLQLLRTAGPDHGLYVLLVSLAAQAVRAYAERCREATVHGSRERWSEPDFGDLPSSPQIFPEGNRHCFEDTRPIPNFPARNINFPTSGSRVKLTRSPVTTSCEKGLTLILHQTAIVS